LPSIIAPPKATYIEFQIINLAIDMAENNLLKSIIVNPLRNSISSVKIMIKEVLLKQFQKIRLKICWKIIRSGMQYSAKSSTSKKQKASSEYLNPKNILYRLFNQYQLQMICANLPG
jgi:hypothetical protein